MQGRAETKRGDQVVGSYQYSDGNVKVKVVYAADDQGYRVLKEERVTLKPFVDPPRTSQPHRPRVDHPDPPARKNKGKSRPRAAKRRPKPPPNPIFNNRNPPEKYSSSYSSGSSQGLYLGSYNGLQPVSGSSHSQQGYESELPELESLGLKLDQSFYPHLKELGIELDQSLHQQSTVAPNNYEPSSTEPPVTVSPNSSQSGNKHKYPEFDNASYAVKLRTNHGTGFSHQGFNLNSGGGSQRYRTKDGEPVHDEEPPKRTKDKENDAYDPSRWKSREEYNRWKDEQDSNRWNGEDSSGKSVPSFSTTRNPVINQYKNHRMEPTGEKPHTDHGTGLSYQFTSNIGESQGNELKHEVSSQQGAPLRNHSFNHGGSVSSHQSIVSSPGKPQKYHVDEEEKFRQEITVSSKKPRPSSTQSSLIPDDDQYNHSLEENDNGGPHGKSKFSGGVKEIPRGKENRHGSKRSKPKKPKPQPIPLGPIGPQTLAIFVKDPPIKPREERATSKPLFRPQNRPKKRRTVIRVRRPIED